MHKIWPNKDRIGLSGTLYMEMQKMWFVLDVLPCK
jgi:hypothetical protein